MSEKKKQHYVPRFYLKYFSVEGKGKALGIFNLNREKYIPRGSLKNQAYENYFYDEEGKVEEALSQLESVAAGIIEDILDEELPDPGTEEHATLLTFIVSLLGRTREKADAINEMADSVFKKILKYDSEFQKKLREEDADLDDFNIRHKYPATFVLSIISKQVPLVSDLQLTLLINKSRNKFLTSDNPVVMYNQFLEKRRTVGSNTGLATKGLQIFFPLTPNHYLILYDSKVYNLGKDNSRLLKVKNSKDINEINTLQFVNANQNVYLGDEANKEYLKNIHEHSKAYSKTEKTHTEELKPVNNNRENKERLLHTYEEDTETELTLSFISETEHAKKYNLGNKVFHCRNRQLLDKFMDD